MFEILSSLDAVLLARIQFAFVVTFHIIFPSFTIGLASWLAVVEFLWLRTNSKIYEEIYRMWVKVFAVCFGLGVVSGVVMSYQFGTNWSLFSDKVGNVLGPLLGYEVLTAFFLEASFLGIMLFGWNRVSRRMHFISTCIVAGGTVVSAFWILSANSWMQTPAGFEIGSDGLLYPTSWLEIIFNPSFPYRFMHMIIAAYLTTAFVVAGVASYYLLKKKYVEHAKKMLAMSMFMAIFVAPTQLLVGHSHGENTMEHQPIKVAAMEANWDRGTNKPLYLFALIDQEEEKNEFAISIPNGASWVLTGKADGEIPGLRDVPADERPPVTIVFWAFRIMVGLGLGMILTGILAIILHYRKKLYSSKLFQYWCIMMAPSGFIAVICGWFVTEVGRQPWSIYGVLRTGDSISPVNAEQIAVSLLIFIIVYAIVFGAGVYYVFKLFKKGPASVGDGEKFYDHSRQATLTKSSFEKK